MQDRVLDDITVLLPPLLQSLDALSFIARHLHPPQLREVVAAVGEPDAPLRAEQGRLEGWPEALSDVKSALETASEAAIAAFDALRTADPYEPRAAFQGLRGLGRAQEALYPLAAGLPPVSRFFLPIGARDDASRLKALAEAEPREDTGVFHIDNEPGTRGGFSLYVPEDYRPDGPPVPLVVALHGGSGNGRSFLWTWLRDARAHGAILVSPTAAGQTWALMGPDVDSPRLADIVGRVRGRWNIDPARLLMTGMSDGGTFSYVSGLEAGSPFTHLAPISAAFHPMLAQFADRGRVQGLPIHIAHGALDWMFPVAQAREAARTLSAAGARVTLREIEDLSHTYPTELNADLLDWLAT
jgi:phospholipase/carboxylesterase